MMISSTAGIADFIQPALPQQKSQKAENSAPQTTLLNIPELKPVNNQKSFEIAEVKEAIDQIQNFTQTLAPNLKFSIDEDTGKTVVKIMDAQTQEVIRQFPSEEAISIARALGKIEGLLFSDKA